MKGFILETQAYVVVIWSLLGRVVIFKCLNIEIGPLGAKLPSSLAAIVVQMVVLTYVYSRVFSPAGKQRAHLKQQVAFSPWQGNSFGVHA